LKKTVTKSEEFRCCDICGYKLSYHDTYNNETCKECGKDICADHRIAIVAFKVLLKDNINSIADMEAFEKHEPIAYRMLCESCFEEKFKETLDPNKFQWAVYGGSLIPKFDLCEHCGYSIKLRNPSGFCDHLYYPDNCDVCVKRIKGVKDE
jgi:hypothetical protein